MAADQQCVGRVERRIDRRRKTEVTPQGAGSAQTLFVATEAA